MSDIYTIYTDTDERNMKNICRQIEFLDISVRYFDSDKNFIKATIEEDKVINKVHFFTRLEQYTDKIIQIKIQGENGQTKRFEPENGAFEEI